jgi:hypothetical protein
VRRTGFVKRELPSNRFGQAAVLRRSSRLCTAVDAFAKPRQRRFFAAVTAPPEKNLRQVSFIAHATRGVIRDQRSRRRMMSALIAVAVLMLIAGTTFLQETLNPREHAVRFILYWLTCAWFTITALLLALFDALMVRAQGRAARKQLQQEYQRAKSSDAAADDHAR